MLKTKKNVAVILLGLIKLKTMKKIFWLSLSLPFAFDNVFAQGGVPITGSQVSAPTIVDPLGGRGFEQLASGIIDFIFTISIPLTAILVLAGGFQMITSAGDPTKFSNGKKTILYAVIGFAVVLLAKGVVGLIKGLVGVN